MTETSSSFVPTNGFESLQDVNKDENSLQWFCAPGSWTTENNKEDDDKSKEGWWKVSQDNSILQLAPPAKRDFWRKTYYQPLLVKDDAPFLYRVVATNDLPITIEASFSITAKSQFDQAGLMVRLDYEHWVKTGIEVVDDVPRLSCVVTNGFSDWSTQPIANAETKIRIHVLPQQGGSMVVEAAPVDTNKWSFIRIAHLNKNMNHDLLNETPEVKNAYQGDEAPKDSVMIGLFGACPVDQSGMVVTFRDFSITEGSAFVHDA